MALTVAITVIAMTTTIARIVAQIVTTVDELDTGCAAIVLLLNHPLILVPIENLQLVSLINDPFS